MFQTEKVLCNKFEWGLWDVVHALATTLEVQSLAVIIAKAHKMEMIVQKKKSKGH